MRALRSFLSSTLLMALLGALLLPIFPWHGLVAGLLGGWLARTPRHALPAAAVASLLLLPVMARWPGGLLGAGWASALLRELAGAGWLLGACALFVGAVLGSAAASGRHPRNFPNPRLRYRWT